MSDLRLVGDVEWFNKFEGSQELLDRVFVDLRFNVQRITQITRGRNNGVFILEGDQYQKVVAKIYQKDDLRRLEREYLACSFLRRHNFLTPKPLLKDDVRQFAVYSFEEGVTKLASE